MKLTEYNFKGKRAFVRVDFNVPLDENFHITDDTRIRAALPTLKYILEKGGSIVIGSHLGRPQKAEEKYSMKHLLGRMEELMGVKPLFASDCLSEEAFNRAKNLKPGEILVLENLRFYAEEEGKPRNLPEDASDEERQIAKKKLKVAQRQFAENLAYMADCYVNDAFGTAHRAHASTAIIADFFAKDNKMYGFLMSKELEAVDKVLHHIEHPFIAIMGGSKVSTKIDIINNLMDKVDILILTGAMSFTFSKAFGGHIGNSLCEDDKLQLAKEIVEKAKEKGVKLVLASDAIIADKFAADAVTKISDDDKIPDGWMGMDIGPKSQEVFRKEILSAKTILWNGPAGVFEMEPFSVGSKAIAEAIAEATTKGAYSLVGGGDSVACINKFGLAEKVSYVSTGGGALLEAIEGKTLPGVAAINA